MPHGTTLQRVLHTIAEQFGVQPEEVTPEKNLRQDFEGCDSLDVVELVMALEDEFGIEIPDEDAEKLNTVQDTVDYIAGQVNR